jgi:glycosyltransferase involved in cell wall biosynthesis
LFIGQCREYKNIPGLIKAFRDLPIDSLLLIAGQFQRDEYRQRVVTMADEDKRIKVYPKHIPDDELQDFLTACDCVVLPYLEILTSGSAMLALSFGRPVVSVRLGCLKDLVNDEVGVLFDPGDASGLKQALMEVTQRRFNESRILAHARRFSWEESARAFIDSLNGQTRQESARNDVLLDPDERARVTPVASAARCNQKSL